MAKSECFSLHFRSQIRKDPESGAAIRVSFLTKIRPSAEVDQLREAAQLHANLSPDAAPDNRRVSDRGDERNDREDERGGESA